MTRDASGTGGNINTQLGGNDMVANDKVCFLLSDGGQTETPSHSGQECAERTEANRLENRLAEKAGLSTVFISRIEHGVESPSIDNLAKIAEAMMSASATSQKDFNVEKFFNNSTGPNSATFPSLKP